MTPGIIGQDDGSTRCQRRGLEIKSGTSKTSAAEREGKTTLTRKLQQRQNVISKSEFIEPMRARLAELPPASDEWIYEIKFDGYRALAFKNGQHVQLLSRNEKDFNGKFPEIVDGVTALDVERAVFDGEIVALDDKGISSFQLLQAFELGAQRPPIYYYVFDLLQLDGKNL